MRFSRQFRTFRHTRTTACLGFLAFALLTPSAMAAENCTAPPGTSGLDQYCEALPSPGGSGGSSHHGGGGSGGSTNHDQIPPGTLRQLQHSGSEGAAVLALSNSAPASSRSGSSSSGGPSSGRHHARHRHAQSHSQQGPSSAPTSLDASSNTSAPASNPASAVGNSVSGSLGAGFFGLLAGIAVLLAALAWLGRRRRPGAQGT